MRQDFQVGKMHSVWERESQIPFYITYLFTTLNCKKLLLETAQTLSCSHYCCVSPCLLTPKAVCSLMLSVCHSPKGDQVFSSEETREFPIPCTTSLRSFVKRTRPLRRHSSFRNSVLSPDFLEVLTLNLAADQQWLEQDTACGREPVVTEDLLEEN